MTKIKFCGLMKPCDIEAANELQPDYIGFVFAPASRRYVSPEQAAGLRELLRPDIPAVGVFVDAPREWIAGLLRQGVIGEPDRNAVGFELPGFKEYFAERIGWDG